MTASIPLPTAKELFFQIGAVFVFSISLGAALWFWQDLGSLDRAVKDLHRKKAELVRIENDLDVYGEIKKMFIPCDRYKTPLFWERIEIRLAGLRFGDFMARLDSLGRDVRPALGGADGVDMGRGGVFLLDRMEMKMEATKTGGETGRGSGAGIPVFVIEGRLLSACGGEGHPLRRPSSSGRSAEAGTGEAR